MMDIKVSSKIMERERQKPQNKYCADCSTISPQWISIKFGVFVCLRCSGIHRSLGTHLTFVRSATLDALKSDVVEQYQTLNNDIMNDYFEFNMPDHRKPQQSTDTKTVERFIKDKYVKKLWINEDEDDPAEMYRSGEYEKMMKKKAKKEKKKKEKKEKKKKDKTKTKTKNKDEPNLIDFQEGDDFGDFQEANSAKLDNDNGFGDLIGGSNDNDDFGDFTSPEKRNDNDDFGDFADPTASTGIDMNMFNSAPSNSSNVDAAKNSSLLNNLSSLYNQTQNS
jgi:stromal membrane-associated protein